MNRARLVPAAIAVLALATAAFACSSAGSDEVGFTVCVDDRQWTPPSQGQQAEFLSTLTRYTQPADAPLEETYRDALTERFFRSFGANSGTQDFYRLSGLWTADEFELPKACRDAPLWTAEVGDLWLLLYEARSLALNGDELTLTVAPTDHGFQLIHWQNPLAPDIWSPAMRIVDSAGREIQLFREIPDDLKSG